MKSYLRSLFWWILDSFIFLVSPWKKKGEGVLLVRTDVIGDFTLWLDAARELRELYTEQKITLVCNEIYVELARTQPYFNAVIPLNRRKFIIRPFYRLQFLARIRRSNYRIAIHPVFSREFLYGDSIVRLSGAFERLASRGDYSNIRKLEKRISDKWYTRLLPADSRPLMELIRNAEFLRALGRSDFKADISRLHYDRSITVDSLINDIEAAEEYYILFPGAGADTRRWPLESFARLANLLSETYKIPGIICGARGDTKLALELIQLANPGIRLYDLTGKTSLTELAALIANARINIANETGAVHIAAATGAPCLCILGGGHFGRFLPYQTERESSAPLPEILHLDLDCFNCNWRCIYPVEVGRPYACVEKIEVETAWRKTVALLDNNP